MLFRDGSIQNLGLLLGAQGGVDHLGVGISTIDGTAEVHEEG